MLTLNLHVGLRSRLGPPCHALATDVKVRVDAADAYHYPDVLVTCDPADRGPYVIHRPIVLAEVLSPGTEAIDRHEKLPNARKSPRLTAILLVHQDRRLVAPFWRDDQGWLPQTIAGNGVVALPSSGVELRLAELYADIEALEPG